MTPRAKDILFEVLLWALLCLLAFMMFCAASGCKGHVTTKGGQMADNAISRAGSRQVYILDEAKAVKPVESARRITTYAKDTLHDLDEAAEGVATLTKDFGALQGEYTKLDNSLAVWIGRKVLQIALALVIGWAVLGTLGAFFVGTPGIIGFLARHVLNFLPLSNPFTALARQRQAVSRG